MTTVISGTAGVTFPDSSVQAVSATNATNITTGTLAKARLPAGSVLQVVSATDSTQLSTSSTSYVDTGLSASITPTSSTSKILIFIEQTGVGKNAGGSGFRVALNILRDSTQLIQFELGAGYTASSVVNVFGSSGANYLDSPASTSSITYKTQIKGFDGGTVYANYDNCTSTITLMEIAA